MQKSNTGNVGMHTSVSTDRQYELNLKTELAPEDIETIESLEKNFPEMTGQFKEFLLDEYITFCQKQTDYGPTNISVGQRLETEEEILISLKGLWFRISDKVQRLFNIILVKNSLQSVNEPLDDTFKDLSVYGKIARIVISKHWGK